MGGRMRATIWGIKNLKKTEKMNHDTGEKITEKRCTGVIEFSVLAKEAGIYEDQAVYILTESEYLRLKEGKDGDISDLNDKCDGLLSLALEFAKTVKELAEKV